jgi:malonyl CoA-acyl carrier protein transacylase
LDFYVVGFSFRSLTTAPSVEDLGYWEVPAISGPLIFITQVANVLAFGFETFKSACIGAAGHSQGLASALVLASCVDENDLIARSR